VVKIKDDLEVASDEVVFGDVVAIMGDALVEGHVQGDVVVILGDLTLGEDAEVDGEVINVLGRLDRAGGAAVGSVTVVNPSQAILPTFATDGPGDWVTFWGWQVLFLVLVFMVLLMMALVPRRRLDRVIGILEARPGESVGIGLLLALLGHMVLLGLSAILVLTVIGIPVALLVLLAVALLDLAAVGVASLVVGRRICARLGGSCGNPWREVVVGMLVLHVPAVLAALLGAVGAPTFLVILVAWLSRGIKFLAFCFGLGALVIGRFGNRESAPLPGPPLPTVADTP
jgi:hypothetical protein